MIQFGRAIVVGLILLIGFCAVPALGDHGLVINNRVPAQNGSTTDRTPNLSFTVEIEPPSGLTQHFMKIVIEDLLPPAGLLLSSEVPEIIVPGCSESYEMGDFGLSTSATPNSSGDIIRLEMSLNLEQLGCTLPLGEQEILVDIWTQEYTPPFPPIFASGELFRWTINVLPEPESSPPLQPPSGRPTIPTPVIDAISPESAGPGDLVTISGSGFTRINNLTATQNPSVRWDETTISTEYIDDSTLQFHVPENASCEFHNVQVRNPALAGGQASNVVQLKVACLQNNNLNNAQYDITSVEAGSAPVFVNQQTTIRARVLNSGSANGTAQLKLYVDDVLIMTRDHPLPSGAISLVEFPYTFDSTGNRRVKVESQHDVYTSNISVSIPPPEEEPPDEDPPPPDDEPPPSPPPPVVGGNSLEDYDTDGDCTLSDTEFFVATDAWISESISDLLFFSAVDAWIGQLDICTASSSVTAVALYQNAQGILISSALISLGAVTVYDTSGRIVFSDNSQSNRLLWSLRTASGQPIANGVYFVRVRGHLKPIMIVR